MISVIPQPANCTIHSGSFGWPSLPVFSAAGKAAAAAQLLASQIEPGLGCRIAVIDGPSPITFLLESGHGPEGSRLTISKEGIVLAAETVRGLIWAGQTLRQLMPPSTLRKAAASHPAFELPCLEILDAPRFPWRGMMLDLCRHYQPKWAVLKMIDALCLHKFNRLHLHLTEDQGWRLEIKRFPRLTEVGAWRSETVIGRNTALYDGKPHGGFLSQDDAREIVAYAAERGITVVPEIEMPGHAQAAAAAYPEWSEPGRQLEVWTKWGVSENVYSVEDATIEAMKLVLDEVLDIFPSEFIHVGGDECPKNQWKQSARTQELMRERGLKNEEELQSWFIRQIDDYLTSKGRRLIGWDEILEGGLAPGAAVMSWRGMEGGIEAAKAGHPVVMAPWSHVYFDHYQSKAASEPLAIGGHTPLEKTYSFEPVPDGLSTEEASLILGTQGQLWSEYIPTWTHLEYMAFPRACALAEVAWSGPARDFSGFLTRLKPHLARLDALGVGYRPLDDQQSS